MQEQHSKRRMVFMLLAGIVVGTIVILLINHFFFQKRPSSTTPQMPSVSPVTTPTGVAEKQPPPSPTLYTNNEFQFQFEYPSNLAYDELGPNNSEQQIAQGQQISGTIQPSLETVLFSDGQKAEQFHIDVFGVYSDELTQAEYQDKFLATYGGCDLRFKFKLGAVSATTLGETQGLQVDGKMVTGLNTTTPRSCLYVKNGAGNLLVFTFLTEEAYITVGNYLLETFTLL